MTCLHQLIELVNMQLAYRHDERPGESYEALDGKKKGSTWRKPRGEGGKKNFSHLSLSGFLLDPVNLH